ncbi:MAG: RtcB family protein [Bacteroidales bacterium]|nr:RtcB family protein [Bacteroidales bacterium]
MNRVISSERRPIKLWTDDIDEGALQQARNLANLPFTFKWVAIMADCHQGYGMPIGGVLATTDVIIPNAVGVDIGCGVCAVKTSLESIEHNTLKNVMSGIRRRVPLGSNHHKKLQAWEGFKNAPDVDIVQQELERSRYQLGTLGSGNHFMEIQHGSDGYVWLMLHSGSRNFGLQIANEYHKKARKLCEMWNASLPDRDLAFLPVETREAKDYLDAMNFALDFARASRFTMIEAMKASLQEAAGNVDFGETINVHHNYAVWERHYDHEVIVHRKGAISAKEGQIGIIPGSQGMKSYIVRGKGNPESFMSCSHGAGRRMGRRQAMRELNLEEEKKRLDDKGIIHAIRTQKDLDEASGAYKDIDTVMENQRDLVDIVIELSPLAVIKD